uniref:Uncharacterized protein n=1 Tax=Phenylobacterium glaciei TaxID=2803784 RepID=A0A974S888_9CAUL|nr:hypothetical protein JKL49_05830 [Phenylobacterium glaciei]
MSPQLAPWHFRGSRRASAFSGTSRWRAARVAPWDGRGFEFKRWACCGPSGGARPGFPPGGPRGPGGPGGRFGGKDLTTGPIGPTLIAFALPVMGSNILQSLNGSANAIWVSHVLGRRR